MKTERKRGQEGSGVGTLYSSNFENCLFHCAFRKSSYSSTCCCFRAALVEASWSPCSPPASDRWAPPAESPVPPAPSSVPGSCLTGAVGPGETDCWSFFFLAGTDHLKSICSIQNRQSE